MDSSPENTTSGKPYVKGRPRLYGKRGEPYQHKHTFIVSCTKELHAKFRQLAERRGVPLSMLIIKLLSADMEGRLLISDRPVY